jgi:hypothetical protein
MITQAQEKPSVASRSRTQLTSDGLTEERPTASGPRKPPTADRHTSSGSKKFGPALVRGSFGTATAPFPQSRHRHPRVSTSHTTSPVMAVSLSRAATIRSCSSLPNNCD